jgi:3-methylfumaryl-CoA hydratase
MTTHIDPELLAHLQTWQGRSETLEDLITPAPLRALSATLDRDDPLPVAGSELPPLWHWLFFLPHHRQSEIGPDGHAKRGGFLPPVPLPRRMWAGGRLQWHAPLRVGDAVKRVSTIQSVNHKAGRTGDLLFVLVKHEVHNAQGLCLTEEHDIVYRPAAQPTDPVPAPIAASSLAEPRELWTRDVVPDDVLLFRYSALTFNGHRIHYDRKYVTQVEGYPGLIVHGPLIATWLVDLVRRHTDRPIRRFEFKALRPTFECADQRHVRVSGQPQSDGQHVRLWAQDHEGWLTMQATAELG